MPEYGKHASISGEWLPTEESATMLKHGDAYTLIVQAALGNTAICEHLKHRDAVVLERIAKGGGAVKWYHCNETSLDAIGRELSPGAVVSFYFDGRMKQNSLLRKEVVDEIEVIIKKCRVAVVGVVADDGIHIDADDIVSTEDLAEFMSSVSPSSRLFYGVVPGRDNDGVNAITVTLPDEDGIVRHHPH